MRSRAARLIWAVALPAILALVPPLAFAGSAGASAPASAARALQPAVGEEEVPVPEGEEEAEAEEEEEEEEEEKLEACVELEGEAGDEGCEAEVEEPEAFEACGRSAADATVTAKPVRDHLRLRLVLHYRVSSPAAVRIGLRFHGRKGSGNLGQSTAHLSHSGVFRESIRLERGPMTRVLAAHEFHVSLRISAAGARCHSELDQSLRSRRAAGKAIIWSSPQPASAGGRA
jgi:hypothetical protein